MASIKPECEENACEIDNASNDKPDSSLTSSEPILVAGSSSTTAPDPLSAIMATTPVISPNKRNKRKMAEPKRRITDFSIRNICSETNNRFGFAGEIETDEFHESKKTKLDEITSGAEVASDAEVVSCGDISLKVDAAPFDVLVSLSLLTQQGCHSQTQETFRDSPSSFVSNAALISSISVMPTDFSILKQSKRKPTKTGNSKLQSRTENETRFEQSNLFDVPETVGLNSSKMSSKDSVERRREPVQIERHFKGENLMVSNRETLSTISQKSSNGSPSSHKIEEIICSEIKAEAPVNVEDSVNEDSSSGLPSSVQHTNRLPSINSPRRQQPLGLLQDESSNLYEHQHNNDSNSTSSSSTCRNNFNFPVYNNNNNTSINQRKNYKNMTKQRRIEANARERTRVHTISAAFESLRKAVPSYSHNQRLSKLAILRIACSYILALAKLAELDDYDDDTAESPSSPRPPLDSRTFSRCVDLCTQTIQSEGKTKRRH